MLCAVLFKHKINTAFTPAEAYVNEHRKTHGPKRPRVPCPVCIRVEKVCRRVRGKLG